MLESEESEQIRTSTFKDQDIKLTPWEAFGKFTNEKYKLLVEQFGVSVITNELLERFQRVTGHKPHRLLRRGLFFAHRNLSDVLDAIEAGKKIFLYTGRGPSSETLHLGHIVPMQFTIWLQKVFNAIVVFQIADDEKYWIRDMNFDNVYDLGFKNAKDIIALGFDPNKTFIFSNRDFSRDPFYQKVAFDIMKHVNINQVQAIFGIPNNGCCGQLMWPIYQSTAAFSQSYNEIFGNENILCLVAYAIDQDPYFRLCRDVASKLGFSKPCSIICQFLPALEGDKKMSSTENKTENKTIYMSDTIDDIKTKITKYAFSGGKETLKAHRELGGDPNVDTSFQWLRYFMEDDDELNKIEIEYRSGRMLSRELKQIAIKCITDLILEHQQNKLLVSDDDVKQYYDIKNVKM